MVFDMLSVSDYINQGDLVRSLGWCHMDINTLRFKQNGRHFADDVFNSIFLNENFRISNNISLKYFPKRLIDNISPLVHYGLAPNRRQAIIGTNDSLVNWHIYESLGLNELRHLLPQATWLLKSRGTRKKTPTLYITDLCAGNWCIRHTKDK